MNFSGVEEAETRLTMRAGRFAAFAKAIHQLASLSAQCAGTSGKSSRLAVIGRYQPLLLDFQALCHIGLVLLLVQIEKRRLASRQEFFFISFLVGRLT